MNVVFGKSGKCFYFEKKRQDVINGDDIPTIVIQQLAKLFPQHTFYIVSGNDLTSWKKNQSPLELKSRRFPKNIIDVYQRIKKGVDYAGLWSKFVDSGAQGRFETTLPFEYVCNYFKDNHIKIDFGIFYQGPDNSISIGNRGIYCKTKNSLFKPLLMAHKYVAPVTGIINEFDFPFIFLNEDPRYIPPATYDILRDPEIILSQASGSFTTEKMLGYYEDSKKTRVATLNYKYSRIETFFFSGENFPKINWENKDCINYHGNIYKKDIPFTMALKGTSDREPYIEEWILKSGRNPKIYGPCWSKDIQNKYPGVFEDKKIAEMEDIMLRTKFTFIPFYLGNRRNFITQKFWKMIYYGIIPFWDIHGYDTDHYLEVPDYFRIKNPEEMWKKINYLCSFEGETDYQNYLSYYYSMLKDDYFNGKFIFDTFKPWLDRD